MGRQVSTLAEKQMIAGYHDLIWESGTLSNGIYVVRMETVDGAISRKIIMLK